MPRVAVRNGRVVMVASGGWATVENPWERRRTLLAYSEDEPRDEHGRWTEGEGDAAEEEHVARRSDGTPMVTPWPTDQMDDHRELPGHWVPAEEVPDYLYHVGPREYPGDNTIDSIRAHGLLPGGGEVGTPHPGQDWESDINGVYGHETLGGALNDVQGADENYDGEGRYGIYRFPIPEDDKWQVRADSESSLAMTAPVPPTRIDVWEGDYNGNGHFEPLLPGGTLAGPANPPANLNDSGALPVGHLNRWGETASALLGYSEDQPRDDHGRWTEGEGGGSSLDEKLPPEPSELDKAIEYYHSPKGPADLNAKLRNGHELTPEQQQVVNALDAGMRPLEESTIVYRGVPDSSKAFGVPTEELNALVGSRQTDAAFMSTSTDPQTADIFGAGVTFVDDDPVVVEIEVPAGYPALAIPEGDYGNQQELLLPRGTQLEFDYVPPFGGAERQVDSHLILAHVVQGRQLTAATLLAYSDDQPRDDHGRWTGGGGGADDGVGFAGLTTSQVEAKLNARYPNTAFSFPNVPDEYAQRAAASWSRMADKYPDVAAKIPYLGVDEKLFPGALAGTATGTNEIALNPRQWSDPEYFQTLEPFVAKDVGPAYAGGSGGRDTFWPSSYLNNPDGIQGATITHEFGHAFSNVNPGVANDFDRRFDPDGTVNLGGYADYSPGERFAEVFEMMQDGDPANLTPDQRDAVTTMRRLFEKDGFTAAALLAYSDEQPRDDHGRWSPEGGGGAGAGDPGWAGGAYAHLDAIFGDHLHVQDLETYRVRQNLTDLDRVPEPILTKLSDSGLEVYAGAKPIYELDEAQPIAAWPSRDDIIGVYNNEMNSLSLSDVAPADSGTSTALHETGHAVQAQLMSDTQVDVLTDWDSKLWDHMSPYEQGGGAGSARSTKEFWGESFARYLLGGTDNVTERYGNADYSRWVAQQVEDLKK